VTANPPHISPALSPVLIGHRAESRRLRAISFGGSILLHLIVIMALGLWSSHRSALTVQPDQQVEKLRTFRLVETPERARTSTPPEKVDAVSDKNARAQNPTSPENLPEGEAYAPFPFPVPGEGGFVGSGTGEVTRPAQEQRGSQGQGERSAEIAPSPGQAAQGAGLERFQMRPKFSIGALGEPLEAPSRPKAGGGQQEERSRFIGPFSLNTYAWDFAPYVLHMKRRLEENLYPPPAFTRMGLISGNVVLHFKVMPDGHVEDLEVEEYDCHPSLVECSLMAVRNSSPFRPLPKDFPEPYLELRWKFMYIVYR
jgi:hypothetical protein